MKKLSHLDEEGRARMVDVGGKEPTRRRAVASALVRMSPGTRETLAGGTLPKGDAPAVVRLAGIQGAKWTSTLIPLCHPLPLDRVAVELREDAAAGGIRIYAEARTRAATGVEMEALTAAAVASLALIDMVKGVERGVVVESLRLELKEGGKSGLWRREGFLDPWSPDDGAGS
jgi:cyclic pyranopterin phosphate synthase